MHRFKVHIDSADVPGADGEVHVYVNEEAAAQKEYFDPYRRVVFINGMKNTGLNHAESALVLSLVQMCPVIGVYNWSAGTVVDLMQCLGDKNQFNGLSWSAPNAIKGVKDQSAEIAMLKILERNRAQVSLYKVLLPFLNRKLEIFAHSQGNLILSNVLQAHAAVNGKAAIQQFIVHTFGSPAVTWPKPLTVQEHGFTFDPVNWLSGLDSSFSISKVGMPAGSLNPFTHGFLEYMTLDPEFFVNRFRTGGFRMTFNMDEEGLAEGLVAMGSNMPRVKLIFQHLYDHHQSDVDDVAVLYVNKIRENTRVKQALRSDPQLVQLLIKSLDEGWTSKDEQQAIDWLKAL